ncbi:MAG TPA: paraquat-inducible protein A [Rhizobiales bacterium]|nr:paraquat-inducible protein A [Hyphomicrobiales bacterium]
MSFLLPLLLALVAFSFGLGLVLPLVSMDKLLLFTETPSLLSILMGLWQDGEPVLAGIVGLFSLVFPSGKILLLHYIAYKGRVGRGRSIALLGLTSKWSMMDVLLVALVVFSAKTSGLATASVLPGLWFYAFATLGSAFAAMMIKR